MELYTTLVHAKRAMNGGELPPMTPVPENVRHFIDPEFTIGLGALDEDAEKGLRCPVRDCGKYFHRLNRHLDQTHAELGGQRSVKHALSIPQEAKLYSVTERVRLATNMRSIRPDSATARMRSALVCARQRANKKPYVKRTTAWWQTVGSRNLRDMCEAQIKHRMIDLQNTLRRPPTWSEARTAWGSSAVEQIRRLYGDWDNVLAQCGLETVRQKRHTRETVITALRAYYDVNGELPGHNEASAPARTPLIPSAPTILKVFGKRLYGRGPTGPRNAWQEVMEIVAGVLGIVGGRYGLNRPPGREVA